MLDSILADREMVIDVVKNGTMLISSRLLAGGKLGDNIWEMSTVYVLVGFIVFHLVVKKIIPSHLIHQKSLQRAFKSIMRIGTMFVVSRLLSGGEFNLKWGKQVIFILVGYAFYEIVTTRIVNTDGISSSQIKLVIEDTTKMITVAVISRALEGKSFTDNKWLLSVLFTIVGFAVYDVGISNFI